MIPVRAIAAVILMASLAACGGGEDAIGEDSLRDCLADQGLSFAPPAGGASPGLGNVSPDFSGTLEGGGEVDLVVEGNEAKARRKAADIRGALQAFGVTRAGDRLMAKRNVIAVFDRPPSSSERDAVAACLE